MTRSRRHLRDLTRPALTGVLGALACLVVAATAFAAAIIYSNDFSGGSEMRELKPASKSKACDRSYDAKHNGSRIRVKNKRFCAYVPPVRSDGDRGDLVVRLEGRIAKSVPDALREDTYLAVGARGGYVFKVYPKGKRYRLERRPNAGEFPVAGRDSKIRGIGEANELSLQAFGNDLVAKVNGKTVARVSDARSEDIKGRMVEVGVGLDRKADRVATGTLKSVRVAVPNP